MSELVEKCLLKSTSDWIMDAKECSVIQDDISPEQRLEILHYAMVREQMRSQADATYYQSVALLFNSESAPTFNRVKPTAGKTIPVKSPKKKG